MKSSEKLGPVITGASLAITVAIGYAVCAAAWAIWPEAALDFLNALFHGLDFRKILLPARDYGINVFLYPLTILAVWAFLVGALFATVHNLLRRD